MCGHHLPLNPNKEDTMQNIDHMQDQSFLRAQQ